MNDQPDFATLARQYLDLWEDQLTAIAADPNLAEQSARFFDAMTQLGTGANPLLSAQMAELLRRTQSGPRHEPDTSPAAANGSAPPAAASGDRDQRLDQLARRLADIERRLERLEAGSGGKSGKTARRPRKSAGGGKSGRKKSA